MELINLHKEAIYLQGARAAILEMQRQGAVIHHGGKDDKIYTDAVYNEILQNRESLVAFVAGDGWTYYDHQHDKRGKLVGVKVKFKR
jgi:hypothetical protein